MAAEEEQRADGEGRKSAGWRFLALTLAAAVIVVGVIAVLIGGDALKYLLPGSAEAPPVKPSQLARRRRPPVRLADFVEQSADDAAGAAACLLPHWEPPEVVRRRLEAVFQEGESKVGRYSVLFPAPEKMHLRKDYLARRKAWRRKVHVSLYDRFGTKDPRWDEAARKFLARIADRFEGDSDYRLRDELYKQSKALIESGCNDPWIVYCHGNLTHFVRGAEEALPYVKAGYEGLLKSRYPRWYVYWAAKRLALISRELYGGNSREAQELDRKALFYYGQAAGDDMFGDMVRAYAEDISSIPPIEQTWVNRWQPLLDGLASVKKPDPWAAAFLRAYVYKTRAWKDRGAGWAYTVQEAGWKKFREEMKIAREEATKAWELRPDIPDTAGLLIDIAMGSCDRSALRKWFQRAVAAEFDYTPAYATFSWAILPRWGGTPAEQTAFGLACFRTDRFDTWVPDQVLTAFARIGMDLHEHWREWWLLPEVRRIVKEFPSKRIAAVHEKAPWPDLMKQMAVYLWACGDYERLDAYLKKIGPWWIMPTGTVYADGTCPDDPYRETAIALGRCGEDARRVLGELDGGGYRTALGDFVDHSDAVFAASPEAAFCLLRRLGAVRGTPPVDDADLMRRLITVWGKAGCQERILRACNAAAARYKGEALPAFYPDAVKYCGPFAPAFAVISPAPAAIGLDAQEGALKRIAERARELREEESVTAGSASEQELVTARLIAEARCLLYARVKDRNRPQMAGTAGRPVHGVFRVQVLQQHPAGHRGRLRTAGPDSGETHGDSGRIGTGSRLPGSLAGERRLSHSTAVRPSAAATRTGPGSGLVRGPGGPVGGGVHRIVGYELRLLGRLAGDRRVQQRPRI